MHNLLCRAWVKSTVWTERMLTALEQGVKGEIPLLPWVILHGDSLRCSWSTLFEVNHRLENRIRENRMSGSEGGGTGNLTGPSYPIHIRKYQYVVGMVRHDHERIQFHVRIMVRQIAPTTQWW